MLFLGVRVFADSSSSDAELSFMDCPQFDPFYLADKLRFLNLEAFVVLVSVSSEYIWLLLLFFRIGGCLSCSFLIPHFLTLDLQLPAHAVYLSVF